MFQQSNLYCLFLFNDIFGYIPKVYHFTPLVALRIRVRAPQISSQISLILAVTYGTVTTLWRKMKIDPPEL
jgi:hypothetical protein